MSKSPQEVRGEPSAIWWKNIPEPGNSQGLLSLKSSEAIAAGQRDGEGVDMRSEK